MNKSKIICYLSIVSISFAALLSLLIIIRIDNAPKTIAYINLTRSDYSAPHGNAADITHYTILSRQTGNVISKNIVSEVILKAKFSAESIYARDITIDILDDNGIVSAIIHPETDYGYFPQMQLLPFDDSGINRIYLGMGSGGSGGYGYNYVYSAESNNVVTLFDYNEFNSKSAYSAEYADCYKVKLSSIDKKLNFVIDISERPAEYLSGIYYDNGRLIKAQSADVYDVSSVFPYFNSSLGIYQLSAFQRIIGLFGADGLGNVVTRLKLDGNKFLTEFVSTEIYPTGVS